MSDKTYGQVGYDAYGDEANWKAYNDAPMPRWDDPLRDDIKRKWEVAAKAIADRAVSDFKKELRIQHEAGTLSSGDVLEKFGIRPD